MGLSGLLPGESHDDDESADILLGVHLLPGQSRSSPSTLLQEQVQPAQVSFSHRPGLKDLPSIEKQGKIWGDFRGNLEILP